jgi:hypothetical protein
VRGLPLAAALLLILAWPATAGGGERPDWAERRSMTLLVDSVLLGGESAVCAAMPDWRIGRRGRPALMIDAAEREVRGLRSVPRLVVIGLGYNSLWERDRRNYGVWSGRFDRSANRLLRTLRARGAEQLVWVTLRRPTIRNTPPGGYFQLRDYAWYFPYVNARLRRLARSRDDLVLADWASTGRARGLTYDAIHLTPRGARRMARTIENRVRGEARRQSAS